MPGVIVVVASFAGGYRCDIILPLSFIKNPLLWVDLMSQLKATWTAAPDFGYRLVARRFKEARARGIKEPIQDLDLSSILGMQNAAEPIRKDTHAMFQELFLDYGLTKNWFASAYGLAENVVYVSYLQEYKLSNAGAENGAEFFAVGHRKKFPPSQVVKIVNPETCEEVDDENVGEIWLSGPSVTGRYFNQ